MDTVVTAHSTSSLAKSVYRLRGRRKIKEAVMILEE
jgi:hypothetical protein